MNAIENALWKSLSHSNCSLLFLRPLCFISIKSFKDNSNFDEKFIVQLGNYYERKVKILNLDFVILKADKEIDSLVNMAALFISNVN